MNSKVLTAVVILVSVSMGTGLYMVEAEDVEKLYSGNSPEQHPEQHDNRTFELGSAHEHALFHIVVNGSEKDLTSRYYQLNARHVHLEGNRSDIVHKHAEGVTWKDFLQTINTRINYTGNGTEICLEMRNKTSCGEGGVYLNGKPVSGFNTEISQGDNFLVVLETEDWKQLAREYMEKELPEAYRKAGQRGHRV